MLLECVLYLAGSCLIDGLVQASQLTMGYLAENLDGLSKKWAVFKEVG